MQVFAKCGILKEDDDGRPRVKIYRDKATGMSKGDGLVSYLKEPSVSLLLPSRDNAAAVPPFVCIHSSLCGFPDVLQGIGHASHTKSQCPELLVHHPAGCHA